MAKWLLGNWCWIFIWINCKDSLSALQKITIDNVITCKSRRFERKLMATILLNLRKLNLLLDQGYFSILRKLHPYFYQPLYQVTVLNLTELIMELYVLISLFSVIISLHLKVKVRDTVPQQPLLLKRRRLQLCFTWKGAFLVVSLVVLGTIYKKNKRRCHSGSMVPLTVG